MVESLRHKHSHLVICDILNATPKDDIGSMEHPMFTLSKNPDHRIRKYEHKGEYIKIIPSVLGMATIFDKDILIFAMSQLMAKINQGERPSQTIRFSAYDLLVSTNRRTDGRSYERLKAAFGRLKGTSIETCIKTGNKEITKGFSLIDYWEIIRETPNGRMEGLELKLSDWLYNAILEKEVLTISKKYFTLKKSLERRIYEICRKHCGQQTKWSIGLELLHKKTGSRSTLKKFKELLNPIINTKDFLEYNLTFSNNKLIVCPHIPLSPVIKFNRPYLKPQTYENATKILNVHGLDKYIVESEWLEWITGKESPRNPDGAFIGFCKMKVSNL